MFRCICPCFSLRALKYQVCVYTWMMSSWIVKRNCLILHFRSSIATVGMFYPVFQVLDKADD